MTPLSHPASTVPGMPDLTDLDRDLLAFERGRWKYAGAKDTAIRETFGLTPTRYYQQLRALLDRPEALQHDGVQVPRVFTVEELVEHFAEQGMASTPDVETALCRVDRNHGPALLFDLHCEGLLAPESVAVVGTVWSMAE